jgi:hypothetical protein
MDAYATSKQCALATVLEFARNAPRLHFNAGRAGLHSSYRLGRDAGTFVRFLAKYSIPLLVPLLMPFIDFEHPKSSRPRDYQDSDR